MRLVEVMKFRIESTSLEDCERIILCSLVSGTESVRQIQVERTSDARVR